MKSILEIVKLSTAFLAERKMERPRRTAEEVVAFVLGLKKMDLYLRFDQPIVEAELGRIRELLKRCGKGEPLEYVLGEVEFLGCRIHLDRRVLIPRPETEILAEMVAKRVESGVLWDVCSGSGCLGIALKKARPDLEVVLSDISADALALAEENAKLNGAFVEILQGDLLAPFEGRRADWIVCNPPYISEAEYWNLDPSVKDFEPKLALVGGAKGTEMYERFKESLSRFLKPGGRVFFEIGASQGGALKKLFPEGELGLDWAGHSRFFTCQ
ncbi:MAG: peptide chain release factor N(5)-glutamine methyltransferase [Chlamydiales bacterium]